MARPLARHPDRAPAPHARGQRHRRAGHPLPCARGPWPCSSSPRPRATRLPRGAGPRRAGGAAPPFRPTIQQDAALARSTPRPARGALLETAAVLGRQVSARGSCRDVPSADALEVPLRDLVRQEFLTRPAGRRARPPTRSSTPSPRKSLYESALASRRRRPARRRGDRPRGLYAGRRDEVVELLAHHFAGERPGQGGGRLRDPRRREAIRRWANAEALAALRGRAGPSGPHARHRAQSVAPHRRHAEAGARSQFALGATPAISAAGGHRRLIEASADPPRRAPGTTGWASSTASRAAVPRCPSPIVARPRRSRTPPASTTSARWSTPAWPTPTSSAAISARRSRPASGRSPSSKPRGNAWWACRTLWHLMTSLALGDWDRSLDTAGAASPTPRPWTTGDSRCGRSRDGLGAHPARRPRAGLAGTASKPARSRPSPSTPPPSGPCTASGW